DSPLDDGLEHHLEIKGRTDRTADLAKGREIAVACLHFLEKSGILYGDQCLIGKRLDQVYLPIGKRLHDITSDRDDPDCHGITEEGNSKDRSSPTGPVDVARGEFWVGRAVWHVDRATLACGLACRGARARLRRYGVLDKVVLKFRICRSLIS